MPTMKFDVLRRLATVLNTDGDPTGVVAPDLVLQNSSTAVTDGSYEGIEGFLRWRADLTDVLDDGERFELTELIDAGGERLVMAHRLTGRGKSSGAPVDLRWSSLCWVREGMLQRAVGFSTRREALDAAGLGGHSGVAFARALGARDYERVAAALAPELSFRAMTPNYFWDASSPEEAVENVFHAWFDNEPPVRMLTVEPGRVGDRHSLTYGFEWGSDGDRRLMEQHAYYEEREGRIHWLRVICSGPRPPAS